MSETSRVPFETVAVTVRDLKPSDWFILEEFEEPLRFLNRFPSGSDFKNPIPTGVLGGKLIDLKPDQKVLKIMSWNPPLEPESDEDDCC